MKKFIAVILSVLLLASIPVCSHAEYTSSEAESSAFYSAGVSSEQVIFSYIVYSYQSGVKCYYVKFVTRYYVVYKIYNYYINAENGNVVASSVDITLDPPAIPDENTVISVEFAEKNALGFLNLTVNTITDSRMNKTEVGGELYSYDFTITDRSYQYFCSVNAKTGEAVSTEKNPVSHNEQDNTEPSGDNSGNDDTQNNFFGKSFLDTMLSILERFFEFFKSIFI